MLSNIISLAIKNLAINDHTSFHDENLKNDFNSVFLGFLIPNHGICFLTIKKYITPLKIVIDTITIAKSIRLILNCIIMHDNINIAITSSIWIK